MVQASSIPSVRTSPQHQSSGPPIALTIAGFDPSSGAGITADLKVFAAHRVYGLAAITALTVQSTQGVRRIEPISPETLRETLDCLASDTEISGVKIGMLATAEMVGVLANFLDKLKIPKEKIVLDPVLNSSSGRELLSTDGLEKLKSDLLPRVGWITPNIDELAVLAGTSVPDRQAIPELVAHLGAAHPVLNIVVTGGHLDPPDDFFRSADGATQWFPGNRIQTTATHGTGCALSSALLSRLLLGDTPVAAVASAKAYVASAMRAAQPVGKGRGPLHHFYEWDGSIPGL